MDFHCHEIGAARSWQVHRRDGTACLIAAADYLMKIAALRRTAHRAATRRRSPGRNVTSVIQGCRFPKQVLQRKLRAAIQSTHEFDIYA